MQNTPSGSTGSTAWDGGTGGQPQRWAWTYRYGMPLLIASIAAVVLSGSGLVTVVALSGGSDGPPTDPRPTSSPPATGGSPGPHPSADPSPAGTPSVQPVVDADCVVGSWEATDVVDELITGTMTLVGDGPIYEYRADGTGEIDYGSATFFDFEAFWGGPTSRDTVTGVRPFLYTLSNGQILHSWQDVFGGATMLGIWYFPDEDTYTAQCDDETMILTGDRGSADLVRRS